MSFAVARMTSLLEVLERMAAGDTSSRLPISDHHDELDAIAYCINVLVGELEWTTARTLEEQERRASALRDAVRRAEEAVASKSAFLRNISHEIRTPIAAMMGFDDLLASPALVNEERPELLKRLHANGQAVLSLVGDLIDLARLDAKKIELAPEMVCVFDLVREVLASLEIESRGKGLDVRFDLPSSALGMIRTDRRRLRQILVNVLANAIKFTEYGTIVISLQMAQQAEGEQCVIDITDTGIGIPVDRQKYLFEPFGQADSSITRTYGGSGLGLALSRGLAEQLGGTLVLLRSEPGRGTTMRLTLQTLPPAESRSNGPQPAAADSLGGVEGLRILLAEDHPDVRMASRRMLELAGARVEVAHDGREAVAKGMADTFDVVLMDMRMPHMDGMQATRTLRDQGCDVPIVAMTADPAIVDREEAFAVGCNGCLPKPFMMQDLLACIRSLHLRKEPSAAEDPTKE